MDIILTDDNFMVEFTGLNFNSSVIIHLTNSSYSNLFSISLLLDNAIVFLLFSIIKNSTVSTISLDIESREMVLMNLVENRVVDSAGEGESGAN